MYQNQRYVALFYLGKHFLRNLDEIHRVLHVFFLTIYSNNIEQERSMKKKTNRFLRVITWLMIVGILLVGSGCSSIVSVGDEGTKEKSQSEPTAETESATTDEQNQAETPEQSSEPKPQGKTSNDLIVKSDGKLKIAYLLDALANDSSQRHWQQVQNECETRGWELGRVNIRGIVIK